MAETERPQIYLITPPEIDPATFPDRLASVLDGVEVACLRLALATRDEARIIRAADAVREVAHARDVAVTIEAHPGLALGLGLDGVHLTEGARGVRKARKELGGDAILGAWCAASSHDGTTAAEAGADYVAFGPVAPGPRFDGTVAGRELFAWWAEMIEVPVVAEGGLDAARIADLAPVTDFFALGEEVWAAEEPAAELARLVAAIG